MTRNFTISLSQNPIDAAMLSDVLRQYDGKNPVELTLDFEDQLRKLSGSRHAIALNSGTAGIHLGLKSLNVTAGDLVIAPTFTYVASVSPLLYLNAEPVLVDCNAADWNMDLGLMQEAIESCIAEGKKPKAIIAVHIYGMPAQMDQLMDLAKHFDIPVLEDAAEAIGSSYKGKPLGTIGRIGVLSFNNNKILTTYGGGAILVNDDAVSEKIIHWATHARKNLPYYEHEEEGYNYRISPLSAAGGIAGLKMLDKNVAARKNTFVRYQTLLHALPGIGWQEESGDTVTNRWFSCITLEEGKDNVEKALSGRSVETRPLWNPMHRQPLFKHCRAFLNGNADKLFKTGLCLPSGNNLTPEETEKIAEVILNGRN